MRITAPPDTASNPGLAAGIPHRAQTEPAQQSRHRIPDISSCTARPGWQSLSLSAPTPQITAHYGGWLGVLLPMANSRSALPSLICR